MITSHWVIKIKRWPWPHSQLEHASQWSDIWSDMITSHWVIKIKRWSWPHSQLEHAEIRCDQKWSECDQSPPQPHSHLLLEKLLFLILQRLITIIWTARLWSLNNQHNGQNVGLITVTVTAKVWNQTKFPEGTNWSQLVSIDGENIVGHQLRSELIQLEWKMHPDAATEFKSEIWC